MLTAQIRNKRTRIVITMIIMIIIAAIQYLYITYWDNQKGGYYTDEYLSAQYARSYGADLGKAVILPNEADWETNKWINISEFDYRVGYNEEGLLSNKPLTEVVKRLVNKRPYFGILNIIASNSDENILRVGLKINRFIAIAVMVLLFFLIYQLTESIPFSFIGMIMLGFCGGTVTLATFVRFYILTQLLFILELIILKKIMETKNKIKTIILSALFLFLAYLGYRDWQIFVPLVMSLLLFFALWSIVLKKKEVILLSILPMGAMGLIFVIFKTKFVTILFEVFKGNELPDDGGWKNTVVNNLLGNTFEGVCQNSIRLIRYQNRFLWGYKTSYLLFTIIIVLAVLSINRAKKNKVKVVVNNNDVYVLGIMLPATIVFSIFLILCGFTDFYRRTSCVTILLVIILTYILFRLSDSLISDGRNTYLFISFLLLFILYNSYKTYSRADFEYTYLKYDIQNFDIVKNKGYYNLFIQDSEKRLRDSVLYDCLFHAPDNAQIYFDDKEQYYNLDEFPDRLLVWVDNRNEEFDPIVLEEAGYNYVLTNLSYYSNIYECNRK